MRKNVVMYVCDICGNEFAEEINQGKVVISNEDELRFDICAKDTKDLFGKIEPSIRRGRRVAA